MKTAVIGFPRIGALRELKFSSEKYFRNEITEEELLETGRTLRKTHWKIQKEAGIDFISCNDFSYYDGILDAAVMCGIIPKRYQELNLSELDTYFAMARGYQGEAGDVKALAMKKWFNTNYHYIVPEVEDDTVISFSGKKLLSEFEEAKELGIYVIPMPFMIDGKDYLEEINLTQEEFYQKLTEGAEISTSMPSPGSVTDLWDELLKEYDEIVYIPMSSGLSSSCQTAIMLADDYDGKVVVVNNQRISVTMRQSVLDAMELAEAGKSAAEIQTILEEQKMESSIYIMLNTLTYLKRGGRITPAAAALGTLLKIKPVLQIQGDKLDAFAKARTVKQGKNIMIEAMKKDFRERFHDESGESIHLEMSYTHDLEAANAFKEEVQAAFPGCEILMQPLSLSISCHIGPGALAIACSKKIEY